MSERTTTEKWHDDGILLHKLEDYQCPDDSRKHIMALMNVIQHRPKGAVNELRVYRQSVPYLLRFIIEQAGIIADFRKESDRFLSDSEDKRYKRWTDREDEQLIDLITRDDFSKMQIAVTLGRSVSAISNRVSFLVGRKRVSTEIAGKFFGKANGQDAELELCGTLYKQ